MSDLDAVLARLSALATEGRSLEAINRCELAAVAATPQVRAGRARLDDPDYRPGESGSLASDGKTVELASNDDWRVELFRQDAPSDYIRTAAHRTLIYALDAGEACTLHRWGVEGDLASPTYGPDWRLVAVADQRFGPGSVCSADDARTALDVSGAEGAVFLRFKGERLSPLTHAFDRLVGRHVFSAFADQTVTGRHYVADLIKRLTADAGFLDSLSAGERAATAAFLDGEARNAQSPAGTRWLMLQSVGRLAPESAAGLLDAFRAGDNRYLAEQAARLRPGG